VTLGGGLGSQGDRNICCPWLERFFSSSVLWCSLYTARQLSAVIQVRPVGSLYILTRSKTGWTVAEVWEVWMTDKLLQEFLDPLSIESQLELCHLYLLWH